MEVFNLIKTDYSVLLMNSFPGINKKIDEGIIDFFNILLLEKDSTEYDALFIMEEKDRKRIFILSFLILIYKYTREDVIGISLGEISGGIPCYKRVIKNIEEQIPASSINFRVEDANELPDFLLTFDKEQSTLERICGSFFKIGINISCIEGVMLNVVSFLDKKIIVSISNTFRTILLTILKNPDIIIGDIPMIKENIDLHHYSTDIKDDEYFFIRQFENAVNINPNAIAIKMGGFEVTYYELNNKASELAYYLTENGVRKGSVLVVYMERSIPFIISFLAIQKIGCIYCPLDKENANIRLEYILNDCKPEYIISDERLPWDEWNSRCILYNDIPIISHNMAPIPFDFADAAYIIYTSGSTGVPKGVLVTQKNLTNLIYCAKKQFSFESSDVWSCLHSFGFDFSIWEICIPLSIGGKLIILDTSQIRNPEKFQKTLQYEKITVLNQTPDAFFALTSNFLQVTLKEQIYIKYVILGGSKLSFIKLEPVLKNCPEIQFFNMYGITEATVHVTLKKIVLSQLNIQNSNIGKPLINSYVNVLNRNANLCPVNVVGEICVGGYGIAAGYLNQPILTHKSFIKVGLDKFLYKSGDYGYWTDQGELVYCGRLDSQIKINGHRVELEEITYVIKQIDNVREVCTIFINEQIVSFVEGDNITVEEIKEYLFHQFPIYMIPQIIILPQLPRNINQKIDSKALTDQWNFLFKEKGLPETDETTNIIIALWKEVLQHENFTLEDSFFTVGGNSLKMVILYDMLKEKFNKEIEFINLYSNNTVQAMATYFKSDIQHNNEHMLVGNKIKNEFKNRIFEYKPKSAILHFIIEKSDVESLKRSALKYNTKPIVLLASLISFLCANFIESSIFTYYLMVEDDLFLREITLSFEKIKTMKNLIEEINSHFCNVNHQNDFSINTLNRCDKELMSVCFTDNEDMVERFITDGIFGLLFELNESQEEWRISAYLSEIFNTNTTLQLLQKIDLLVTKIINY